MHMLFVEALRAIHEELRSAEQSCGNASELAGRIYARLKAPSMASKWARERCAVIVGAM